MQIIKSKEKKKILGQLSEQYGIKKIPYLLLRFGKEKIRAFSGSLSSNEIITLDTYLRIETAGVYIAKKQAAAVVFSVLFSIIEISV